VKGLREVLTIADPSPDVPEEWFRNEAGDVVVALSTERWEHLGSPSSLAVKVEPGE
jgi:hypothetical protein